MACTYFTHRGSKKKSNEDAILIGDTVYQGDFSGPRASLGVGASVFAVADGLGAHDDSSLASRRVLECILDRSRTLTDPQITIEQAIEGANRDFYADIERLKQRRPMGAAMAGLFIRDNASYLVSVGDCVIYYSGEDFVGSVFEPNRKSNRLKVEDTFGGLPVYTPVRPAIVRLSIKSHASILLATDGLYDFVPQFAILKSLSNSPGARCLEELWTRAWAAGGPDDISMIRADVAPLGTEHQIIASYFDLIAPFRQAW